MGTPEDSLTIHFGSTPAYARSSAPVGHRPVPAHTSEVEHAQSQGLDVRETLLDGERQPSSRTQRKPASKPITITVL